MVVKKQAKAKAKRKPRVNRSVPGCRVEIPERVEGSAAEVFMRLAPIMEMAGRLDDNTLDSFAYLCFLVADYEAMRTRVQGLGEGIVIDNGNRTMSIHPLEKIRATRSREMAAQLKEWGLTPASLGRLGVSGSSGMTPEARDKHAAFQKFLGGG